jgi:hypothetical protein
MNFLSAASLLILLLLHSVLSSQSEALGPIEAANGRLYQFFVAFGGLVLLVDALGEFIE